jgi:hypothetical protein
VGGTEEPIGRAAGAEFKRKPWLLHEVDIVAVYTIADERAGLVTGLWQSQAHILVSSIGHNISFYGGSFESATYTR